VFGKSASPATSEPKAGGLPSHISVFGELCDAPFGSPATVAIAACLPEHLFSVDGKTDDHVSAPANKVMEHPPWNVEVEREWAPVAAAGLADEGREYPAVRVPRESEFLRNLLHLPAVLPGYDTCNSGSTLISAAHMLARGRSIASCANVTGCKKVCHDFQKF